MKNKINLIACMILIVLLASFVYGFGVASPYWKGNPLTISPGETSTVKLTLQNMIGDNDITITAKIIKGNEIATTEEKNYVVKAGTKDTEVPIEINIPEETEINTKYVVTVSFATITPSEGGGVALGTGIDTTFDVLVVAQAPPETPEKATKIPLIAWIIIVLIVLIIIIILIRRKK